MNEKAIESMNKDEPETALEFLKKADETLTKLENRSKSKSSDKLGRTNKKEETATIPFEKRLDPNYKATLFYNLACCYQRLGMLEECVDYLELATKQLSIKIEMLE
jgi:tetratricopeptide (TPR) repeat protein